MGKSLYSNTNVNNEILRNSSDEGTSTQSLSATTISATTLYGNLIDSKYLQTTVTVTANDFINASTILVKELIPPVGVGKYLRFNTLVGKFKNATIAYDAMPSLTVRTEVGPISTLTPLTILATTEQVVTSAGNEVATGINGSVYLEYKTFVGLPTVGDGDLIFEIEYEILDF